MIFTPIRHLLRSTVLRYAIAGGSASFIEVMLLYTLTEFGGIYYLLSAFIGTTVAFFARFLLQKLFAFQNKSVQKLPQQIGIYAVLYVWAAFSTLGLLYFFTEIVGWWYMLAQVVTILIIASISFFVYKYLIFPTTHAESA